MSTAATSRWGRRALHLDTPEGVSLELELSGVMSRAIAVAIDWAIILTVLTTSIIVFAVTIASGLGNWGGAAALLFTFVLRNFYFVFFEMRWRGQTPGKRLLGIRVVDGSGAPLTGGAVLVRNLTREIEITLPLIATFYPAALWPGVPWWVGFMAFGWLILIAFLPLLNRRRMRLGDVLAGTLVVVTPAVHLFEDLASRSHAPIAEEFAFTQKQLDMYGIYELQVLEKLLRFGSDSSTLNNVAERIAKKIGWKGVDWRVNPNAFLEAFYAALRRRLEHRALFGDRQEFKREGQLPRPRTDQNPVVPHDVRPPRTARAEPGAPPPLAPPPGPRPPIGGPPATPASGDDFEGDAPSEPE